MPRIDLTDNRPAPTKFPFGRFRGQLIEDIPSDYLKWFQDKGNDKKYAELMKAVNEEMRWRTKYNAHFYEEDEDESEDD